MFTTGPGHPSNSGSHSVGAWLTQSLAAIKRRGRSTDDSRLSIAAVGNVDVDEQHQILVSSLVSQGLPPAGRSESLPVQAAADSAAQQAQHAQQIESAPVGQEVKRQPGRPKKAGLGEPLYTPSMPPSSNSHMAPPSAAPVNTDAAVVSAHQVLASGSSPRAQLSPRRSLPEAELDGVHHPAGALLPQQANHRGKGKASVAIDLTKLLKSRTKHQVRDNKPIGSSGGGSGTTLPSVQNGRLAGALMPGADTAAAAQPHHASTAAEALAAAAGSKGVEPVPEPSGPPPAQVQPTAQAQPTADEPAATLSGPLSGTKRRRGRPTKQPVLEVQNLEPEEGQNHVLAAAAASATAADAVNTEVSDTVAAAAAAAANREQQTSVLPRSARKSAASSQPQDGDLAAHPAAAPAAAAQESAADGFSEADQGQEGSDANGGREGRGRAGSHGPELPLSILLDGASNKKRGRPYKNAANAEKAAERAARRAATEAVEKAAYEAAAEAAQVVITAPAMLPVKKRRGRPPKDPAKLAAALAAYHASTSARQASMEAEETFLNSGARQEAAQAAAQASFEEAQLQAAEQPQLQAPEQPQQEEVAPPAPAATPNPVRKKRGRPPKAVAKAVVDNLNSPSDSLPIAALAGGYAFRLDPPNSIEDEDHDQAILDAAAVLTSSLPYPQEVAVRPSPVARQGRRAKGKRKSSNSSADAPKPAAAQKRARGRGQGTSQQWQPTRDKQPLDRDGQMAMESEQERHRLPVREQQSPAERQQNQGERQQNQRERQQDQAERQQDREGQLSKERSRRRQLEVVSSRATAILESIGPDSQPLAGADVPNPDSHPVPGPPGSREYPSPGSDSEPAAPPQSGYPSKRHKSNQPATAASASLEEEQEPVHDDSPEHQTNAMSGSRLHGTQAQTDASSAGTQRTKTASSPRVSGPIIAAAAPAAAEVTSAIHTAPESVPDAIAVKPADVPTTGPVSVLLTEHQAASEAQQLNSEAADLAQDDLLEPSVVSSRAQSKSKSKLLQAVLLGLVVHLLRLSLY